MASKPRVEIAQDIYQTIGQWTIETLIAEQIIQNFPELSPNSIIVISNAILNKISQGIGYSDELEKVIEKLFPKVVEGLQNKKAQMPSQAVIVPQPPPKRLPIRSISPSTRSRSRSPTTKRYRPAERTERISRSPTPERYRGRPAERTESISRSPTPERYRGRPAERSRSPTPERYRGTPTERSISRSPTPERYRGRAEERSRSPTPERYRRPTARRPEYNPESRTRKSRSRSRTPEKIYRRPAERRRPEYNPESRTRRSRSRTPEKIYRRESQSFSGRGRR